MLGTPLISCFKASGDTVKRPGARLRAIATVCIRWVVEHVGLVGGARATGYPRKLDREIFADCPSAKIGSLENFRLYGNTQLSCSYIINLRPSVLHRRCFHLCGPCMCPYISPDRRSEEKVF